MHFLKYYYLVPIIFITIAFTFPISEVDSSNHISEDIPPSEDLIIMIVHSYNRNHFCTGPQREGITQNFADIKNYRLIIHEIYLRTRLDNKSKEERRLVAGDALSRIKKLDPDYIFTTDDNAFTYVGIPASMEGYKILASGLNKPIRKYEHMYLEVDFDNMVIVPEIVSLSPFFNLLEKAQLSPNKFYIIYDNNPTAYYLLENYKEELTGKYSYEIIKNETVYDLKETLQRINKEPDGVLIVAMQSLFDPNTNDGMGGQVPKEQLFPYFVKYNTHHIELMANPLFARDGFSMGCGPDFYEMGNILSKYFVNNVVNKPWKGAVITPIMKVSANVDRLERLGYFSLATDTFPIINDLYRD